MVKTVKFMVMMMTVVMVMNIVGREISGDDNDETKTKKQQTQQQ
jgi:hypothetical protein